MRPGVLRALFPGVICDTFTRSLQRRVRDNPHEAALCRQAGPSRVAAARRPPAAARGGPLAA